MHFTYDELSQLAVQASTLAERLEGNFISVSPHTGQEAGGIAERLGRWRESVAKGDETQFNKRLKWDALSTEQVHSALGTLRLKDDAPLPAWTEKLNALLKSLPASGTASAYRFTDPQKPLPFEDLLAPVAAYATQQLMERAGTSYERLSEQAQISLEHRILQRLIHVCIWPLDRAFSAFRVRKQPLAFLLPPSDPESSSRDLYLAFVASMLEGDLLAFLQQYPALARLLVDVIEFWCDPLADFLKRLDADWQAIEQHFAGGKTSTKVTALTTALSDPHNGGQSVISVTFYSGLTLIYKPKRIGTEVAYYDLVAWLNRKGLPLDLKEFKCLDRGIYGWSEFVTHAPCDDEAALKRYYTRAGLLLGLLYMLNATDCHMENIIACGEYPVLIDMETLVYPRINEPEDADYLSVISPLERAVQYSVQYTGFLPYWEIRPDGQAVDMSGLVPSDDSEIRMPTWKYINTNAMRLEYELVKVEGLTEVSNGPYVAGSADDPASVSYSPASRDPLTTYQEEIASGFEQFYGFLLDHREELLAETSPLRAFKSQPIRFIMRPTRIYAALFEKSLAAEYLVSGLERSILLESLVRAFMWSTERPANWPIMGAEQLALTQLDIPFFSSTTDSTALSSVGGQLIDHVFTEAGYERLMGHIQQLNQDDLKLQLALIRGSIYAHTAINGSEAGPTQGTFQTTSAIEPEESTQDVEPHLLVTQALALAKQISAQAIQIGNGTQWLSFGTSGERYQFQPMGYDLYDGSSGVILFLAALEKITAAGYRSMISDAVKPLEAILDNSKAGEIFAQRMGVGGAIGLGSLVYTLALVSQFLDDSRFLELAQRTATLITPARLAADQTLDVIGGTAGAVLGLLTLYGVTSQTNTLEQAIAGGEHLLTTSIVDTSGYRSWATIDDKPMTGFSHGAAGIAYALLRLYAASGDRRFQDVAQEAINYEQHLFMPEVNNWPDLRAHAHDASGGPVCGVSWCHGAPGIGLARLGGLSALDTPDIRRDVEAALITSQQLSMDTIDHLCCGILGRVETLLVGSRRLARPELAQAAQSKAAWIMRRAQQQHGYTLFPNLPATAVNLGFFQGISGVGYELLRLAYPDALPSVLLWEGINNGATNAA